MLIITFLLFFTLMPNTNETDKYNIPIGTKYQFIDNENNYLLSNYEMDLIGVIGEKSYSEEKITVYLQKEAYDYFLKMRNVALDQNTKLIVCSAYRNYDQQVRLKKITHRAADPGYSEHHLGTTIDIKDVEWDNEKYIWLISNAHNYGFILTHHRGHKNSKYIPEEANHWRYVGISEAKKYYSKHKNKY